MDTPVLTLSSATVDLKGYRGGTMNGPMASRIFRTSRLCLVGGRGDVNDVVRIAAEMAVFT